MANNNNNNLPTPLATDEASSACNAYLGCRPGLAEFVRFEIALLGFDVSLRGGDKHVYVRRNDAKLATYKLSCGRLVQGTITASHAEGMAIRKAYTRGERAYAAARAARAATM